MQIDSDLVGVRSKCLETALTWRQTMNFAAATGDNNPHYLDDERSGGIVAPPMLAVALTWPFSERREDFWDILPPPEVLQRQVHYTEYLVWHAPMRPNDKLTIQGEVVGLLPHRSGTVLTVCYSAVNAAGNRVFDEYSGALLRGVTCDDQAHTSRALPAVPKFDDTSQPVWRNPVYIDSLAAHIYDGCTNTVFPIHTSVRFAHFVGLPGVLLQGSVTLSIAVREILGAEADGDPARLRSLNARFARMVKPGSEITIRLLGRRRTDAGVDAFFDVTDEAGKRVVRDGVLGLAGQERGE
ncbi:MAG: hypothetical protein GWP08_00070 [Nitrospiraceae bacterium]|nr:hypothetical protein [Nitrospiraceae bacterium]